MHCFQFSVYLYDFRKIYSIPIIKIYHAKYIIIIISILFNIYYNFTKKSGLYSQLICTYDHQEHIYYLRQFLPINNQFLPFNSSRIYWHVIILFIYLLLYGIKSLFSNILINDILWVLNTIRNYTYCTSNLLRQINYY